jgi:DNA-binding response OmpR family regulator
VEQGGAMRWSVCVFAAGEGHPRPWASFADLTIVPLDEDLTSAATQPCDLAIAYLPPGDADSLDAFVRAVASRHPLLVVLNEHRPERVVRFLDLGAHDVVPDCISTEELFARGRSIIFRGSALRVDGKSRPDADSRCVPQGQAATTNLRHSESKLFEYLLRHSDRPVPQSELIANVFGGVHAADTSLVRVHVSALRRYLGPYSHGLRTVRARGYILDSRVFPAKEVL